MLEHATNPAMATPIDRLGRPMHDLRISVTDRCNLRCTYCMPQATYGEHYAFLPREALLRFEEIVRIATVAASLGVRKLRITGGEPLLRRDLPQLVSMLHGIPDIDEIALTTNGLLLQEHAQALESAGLDRITVSLDSLDDATFAQMNGLGIPVDRVFGGIASAEAAGFAPIKINAVIQRGVNDQQIVQLAQHFRGTPHILRFIEYMDVGTLNHWSRDAVVTSREMLAQIAAQNPLHPVAANYPGEVAARYAYDDGAGEIGFISSVSQPFCGGCTRLRLSADGQLFTCLFAAQGFDLRGPIRDGVDDQGLRALMESLWRERTDRYSEERAVQASSTKKVEMYHIGG